jgi:ribosomal protein S18 acetylase RimI-like enzyme
MMTRQVAEQIAKLLNTQNQLTVNYTAEKVLQHQDRYIVEMSQDSLVLGFVEVKKVQWYQCEIDHLSVRPDAKGEGLGKRLVILAEEKAKELAARVVQCTIRVANVGSNALFMKMGYSMTVQFVNEQSGNLVNVYQKALTPLPDVSVS